MTSLARSVLFAVPLAVGCGGQIDTGQDAGADGGQPPPVVDAQPPPPTSDATPPPVVDGGQCNNLMVMGPPVTFNQVAANPPSFPSGGSPIFQGGYVLTSFTAYSGPSGSSSTLGQGEVTLGISGASSGLDLQVVAVVDNQAPTRSSQIATITGPNQLTFEPYCPQASPAGPPASYYFDGATLWLRASGGNGLVVDEQYSLMTN